MLILVKATFATIKGDEPNVLENFGRMTELNVVKHGFIAKDFPPDDLEPIFFRKWCQSRGLSNRVTTALGRNKISSLRELFELTAERILSLRAIGESGLREIMILQARMRLEGPGPEYANKKA